MRNIHLSIMDEIDPVTALECVRQFIEFGRVNGGKSYCRGTSFLTEDGYVWVTARKNRKSDDFLVFREKDK